MQKKFHRSQFLSDSHENQHRLSSDQSAQRLLSGVFSFDFVCPLQPITFGGDGVDLYEYEYQYEYEKITLVIAQVKLFSKCILIRAQPLIFNVTVNVIY